jgi:hypothetical protein
MLRKARPTHAPSIDLITEEDKTSVDGYHNSVTESLRYLTR